MDTGTLTVPGAGIYYEMRGSGPTLLHGGDGDAAMFGPLAGLLADRYTVITMTFAATPAAASPARRRSSASTSTPTTLTCC
jgi:hypothetical protein